MTFGSIELLITSPPERDFLCCELAVDWQALAEVRIEPTGLAVQLIPKPGGGAWDVPYTDLMAALGQAQVILSEVDTSVVY